MSVSEIQIRSCVQLKEKTMFPVFEIFGRQIGVYGIMAAVGFAACFLVGRLLIRRYDIDVYDFALTMIAAGIGMAVGAAAAATAAMAIGTAGLLPETAAGTSGIV